MIETLMGILGTAATCAGEKLAKEMGAKAAELGKELLDKIFNRLKKTPKGEMVVSEFEKKPQTWAAPMQEQIEELLAENESLKLEISRLVEAFEQAAREHGAATGQNVRITVIGSGAAASHSGTAAGKGGIAIGGSVIGNSCPGNQRDDNK